jgi:hypothetical protein
MSREVLIEQYTYASIIAESQNRVKHENCCGDSSRKNKKSFSQTDNFEEAISFAVNGWDLGLEQYKIEDGMLVGGTTELCPSLSGSIPHIQNHIMGFPQEMYYLADSREYNLPTLDIVVNLAYNGGVRGENALEFGKSLVDFINKKASTRNIRVTGVFASRQSKNIDAYHLVTLKDFDSALVINNIAFAFHPSFFRRLWFSIIEGKYYWSSGYGSTINNYYDAISDKINTKNSDELLIFKTLNDIDSCNFKWQEQNLKEITF